MPFPEDPIHELAEVRCGTRPYVEKDGSITTLLTIQFSIFDATAEGEDNARRLLPAICMHPDDALQIPAAVVATLKHLLPSAYQKHFGESSPVNVEPAPPRPKLN